MTGLSLRPVDCCHPVPATKMTMYATFLAIDLSFSRGMTSMANEARMSPLQEPGLKESKFRKVEPWAVLVATAVGTIVGAWTLAWMMMTHQAKEALHADPAIVLTEITKACGAFLSAILSALILRRYDHDLPIKRLRDSLPPRLRQVSDGPAARELLALDAKGTHEVTDASFARVRADRRHFAECVSCLASEVIDIRTRVGGLALDARIYTLESWRRLQNLHDAITTYSAAHRKTYDSASRVQAAVRDLQEK